MNEHRRKLGSSGQHSSLQQFLYFLAGTVTPVSLNPNFNSQTNKFDPATFDVVVYLVLSMSSCGFQDKWFPPHHTSHSFSLLLWFFLIPLLLSVVPQQYKPTDLSLVYSSHSRGNLRYGFTCCLHSDASLYAEHFSAGVPCLLQKNRRLIPGTTC